MVLSVEASKPTKNRRLRGLMKRNRKKIVKVLIVVVILGVTAGISYNMGVNQGSTNPKGKVAVTAPSLDKLKEAAKNAPKKASNGKPGSASALNNSSGFFRLAGTIESVKKETIAIKLADGTIVTLAIGKNAKFYTAFTPNWPGAPGAM